MLGIRSANSLFVNCLNGDCQLRIVCLLSRNSGAHYTYRPRRELEVAMLRRVVCGSGGPRQLRCAVWM
jgi:hypothetical protein